MDTNTMPAALRYLHLSDLHFTRGDMAGADWAADRLKQDLVNHSLLEILAGQLQDKNLDFVIITGDIAYSGKREEYEVAAQFFQRLAEITRLPPARFYPVAGNHDVNRTQVARSHRGFYRFDSQEDINDTLADPDLRPLILRKFSEFNDFAEKIMGRRHYSETTYHLTETLRLDKNGKELAINLLGLNSALFAGFDGDEKQGLALSLAQADKALAQMAEEARLSIGFFHHPFSVLHPEDEVCANRLKHKLDLILHGHLHHADSAYEQGGAGQAVMLSAGAAYQSRDSRNSFNLVEIDLNRGEGQAEFFKYLPEHHCWNRDNDVCPHDPQGLFHFRISALENFIAPDTAPPEPKKPPGDNEKPSGFLKPERSKPMQICLIHDYLLPDDFTGREQERSQLTAFLRGESEQQASVTAICALGGMGKSCLARRVLQDLSGGENRPDAVRGKTAPYQQAVWFSFYESRTEDEAYAFKEILSFLSLDSGDSLALSGAALARQLRKLLCRYLDQNPVLLILDGLEVIQHTNDPHSPHYGQIHEGYKETLLLIRHCCNQSQSRILITTRVPLTDLEGAALYAELSLPVLSADDAAEYLQKLGVSGDKSQLNHCAELFGGHPLCLKAAGKQMKRRRIPAGEVQKLIGDADLFRRTSEGERVAKIVNTHRTELSPEQEYFLQMLSIHPRSVMERHFSALVRDYGENGRDSRWVRDEVIYPLETRGLIEVLDAPGNTGQYSAHPLMKLAFAAWLGAEDKNKAHEQWAKSAETSPALAGSPDKANSLEALQPWLDVVEHYLDAEDWDAAWQIYRGREVDLRLLELTYVNRLLALGLRFEQALRQGWGLVAGKQRVLYEYLGHACGRLERLQEEMDYREKAFATAQTDGDVDYIVGYGASLAESHANQGNLQKARVVLVKIKSQAEALSAGFAKRIYQSVQAKTFLFLGEYQQTISLYEAITKAECGDYNLGCLNRLKSIGRFLDHGIELICP
ncbi:MAG: AAA family ATPase [Gammaproteobacteria bacterium]|nr:AAA family ATPase [Gammaproteobacteria bacterium]